MWLMTQKHTVCCSGCCCVLVWLSLSLLSLYPVCSICSKLKFQPIPNKQTGLSRHWQPGQIICFLLLLSGCSWIILPNALCDWGSSVLPQSRDRRTCFPWTVPPMGERWTGHWQWGNSSWAGLDQILDRTCDQRARKPALSLHTMDCSPFSDSSDYHLLPPAGEGAWEHTSPHLTGPRPDAYVSLATWACHELCLQLGVHPKTGWPLGEFGGV